VLAGLAILPFSLGLIATAWAAARLLPRYGPRPLLVGGGLAATMAMIWLGRLQATSGYPGGVLPAARALLNATQQIGGAVGVALFNTLYTASQA